MDKICPMMSRPITVTRNTGYSRWEEWVIKEARCRGQNCAWWYAREECCSIQIIAWNGYKQPD